LSHVARIPRCAYPDGTFHVGARGVAQMPIYRDDEDRLGFLYVMENPVRAGLCRRTTDWRWSGCRYELG
jgi:hypothetical protein